MSGELTADAAHRLAGEALAAAQAVANGGGFDPNRATATALELARAQVYATLAVALELRSGVTTETYCLQP